MKKYLFLIFLVLLFSSCNTWKKNVNVEIKYISGEIDTLYNITLYSLRLNNGCFDYYKTEAYSICGVRKVKIINK